MEGGTVQAVADAVTDAAPADWADTLTVFLRTQFGGALMTVLVIAFIVAITLIVKRASSHFLLRIEKRMRAADNTSAALVGFARHLVGFLIYAVGVITVISCIPRLESALNRVLAAGGVLAVVLGIASQEALGGMVSGMMILLFKPFRLGDVVRYLDHDISGVIEEITIHHTTIRTWENKRVIVPNSKMNNAILENADYNGSKVCLFLEIGITYESDTELALALLRDEVAAHPAYLDNRTPKEKADGAPLVSARVIELADSAVILRAWLWAADNGTAFNMKYDLLQSVKRVFDETGVEIAYPHVVVVPK